MLIQYTSKPTIYFYHPQYISKKEIIHVSYGIEEEGIPFKFIPINSKASVIECAYRASQESPLLVGIACDKQDLVLHYRNLPADCFIYRIKNYSSASKRDLRLFGSNAARLVKGIPFKKNSILETSF